MAVRRSNFCCSTESLMS